MELLNHRIYGSTGTPVYILHGIFGMLDNWHYMAGKLAENHMVVSMDARNHGKSFHHFDMDFDCMADDVMGVMHHHSHTKIHILGHSMGGKTAMKFAEKYPDSVEKLIVADIAPKTYKPAHMPYFQAFEEIDFSVVQSRGQAEELLSPYAPDMAVRQFLLKNLEPVAGGGYKPKFNLAALQENYQTIIGELPLKPACFGGPALFISGEKSGYIKSEDHELIKKAFPSAVFTEIAGAGHWVHADNPAAFLTICEQFLQS